ncbi:hypothetical protein [Streptomyces pseudovenezuelae]|uniref:hypothetical protein n=1 Tax=Streptomyces pseudovenezuelae TaxID=67350 RepID=UPI002E307193|nr:hypothetical protein [Streptomyces pseudovenezuelae]
MVHLEKTPHSIAVGRFEAHMNRRLRGNDLTALYFEFGERAHRAEVKAFEAHKAEVLGR